MTRRTGFTIAIAAAIVVAIVVACLTLPLLAWLMVMVEWVRGAGTLGLLAYGAVFVAVSLSLIPTSPLYVATGILYGALWGAVNTVVLSVIASAVTFALARTVLRGWVQRRVAADARVAAIDHAIGSRAFLIAWLLRFSPIVPYGPCNYLLSATKISFPTYLVTMVLGTLPGTIVLAYAGSLVDRVGDVHASGTGSTILLWVGIAATIVVTILLGQIGKRALARELPIGK